MADAVTAEIIGSIAGTMTTLAFVPQVVKTWKTRQTRDISLTMWLLFWLGVALWLAYGVMITAWPVIIANVVTLVLAGIVLGIKLANRSKE